jgi:hypothetical protein
VAGWGQAADGGRNALRQFTHRAGITALVFTLLLVQAPPALAKNNETVALVPPDHAGEPRRRQSPKIVQKKNGDRMIACASTARSWGRSTTFASTATPAGCFRHDPDEQARPGPPRSDGGDATAAGRERRRTPDDIEITGTVTTTSACSRPRAIPARGRCHHYEGDTGHHAFITLISIPAPPRPTVDLEVLILSLTPPVRSSASSFELITNSVSGDGAARRQARRISQVRVRDRGRRRKPGSPIFRPSRRSVRRA